jgi:hypothetical protein
MPTATNNDTLSGRRPRGPLVGPKKIELRTVAEAAYELLLSLGCWRRRKSAHKRRHPLVLRCGRGDLVVRLR